MKTEIIDLTENPEEKLEKAINMLKAGEVVAFPTETVYGLGADVFNTKAVKKIFTAKNRPSDNPLIVHISNKNQLPEVATNIPEPALKLMDKFWPGPLSLVLPKNQKVPHIVTAGLDTVVVRMVSHPLAVNLIEKYGTPLAAPSANLSGRLSPTKAEHVLEDLNGRIPLILTDNNTVKFGIESTVLDCTTEPFTILRPGSITADMLKESYPQIRFSAENTALKSPGMKYRHYSPISPIVLFVGKPENTAAQMIDYLNDHQKKVAILFHSANFPESNLSIKIPTEAEKAAPKLFASLRTLDNEKPEVILVQGFEKSGVGISLMNRLEKAATLIK